MSDTENSEALPPSVFIPNPSGSNQYKDCRMYFPSSLSRLSVTVYGEIHRLFLASSRDDERVKQLIHDHDQQGVKSPKTLSELLLAEHNIVMSPINVSQRKRDYGIMSSKATTRSLPDTVKRQMEGICMRTGLDLTRDFVEEELQYQDPEGFQLRDPTSKRIKRRALVNLGIHEEWSGDGHDKLKRIGVAIYGIRDVWSGKWLGLWVIPDNRLKDAIAYLWLSLVEEYSGLPIQTTTDCGSETTMVYGLTTALREAFFPDFPVNEVPLKFQFDANVDEFWNKGFTDGIYDPYDEQHIALARWLWSVLIQKEITQWKNRFNAHKPRCDHQKFNPSGVALNVVFALYEKHGGINCLRELTEEARVLISDIKKKLGAEELLQFIPPAFAERCEQALTSLNLQELSFTNVWEVFRDMFPLIFEEEL
ncbi:hypothetical protein M422DRAFT_260518 [Sphaerobolus stellatus SS14]|uniref:Unplaced genomic scaffold SPHSTscaffold_97, whole genome shotgun sequence n=1 Tax=Sphaerobolus stellatus (strain SS14) TaxID=990650 RepID=A0A0C9V6A5_SPHS4|nr:hypothetical protein M422DRAFT_260518 [Sphaerobolus stellatus SS14]